MEKFSLALALALCLVSALGQPVFEQNLYEIRNDEGVCSTFRMAASFLPTYVVKSSMDSITREVNLPGENYTYPDGSVVTLDGSSCQDSAGTVQLVVNFARQVFRLTVRSVTNNPSAQVNGNWSVSKIQVTFDFSDEEIFPDSNDTKKATFEVVNPSVSTVDGNGGLYKCNSPVDFMMNSTSDNPIPFTLKDVLLNPFQESTDQPEVECSADSKKSSDDVVPIAVGCALGGLLLIVIIAFLIGKRSRKAEYTKV